MKMVEKAVSSAPGPIKGVVQLVMVLRVCLLFAGSRRQAPLTHNQDKTVIDMSHEEWVTANLPKADGTWNLHNALVEQPSDVFFMSSSTVKVVNEPRQGNYNVANTFLEAFCHYRHSLGLPASVINICPIDDVGYVAENPAAQKSLKAQGSYFLQERESMDYLRLSPLNPRPPARQKDKGSSCQPSKGLSSWENTAQIIMGLRTNLHPDDSEYPHQLAPRPPSGCLS